MYHFVSAYLCLQWLARKHFRTHKFPRRPNNPPCWPSCAWCSSHKLRQLWLNLFLLDPSEFSWILQPYPNFETDCSIFRLTTCANGRWSSSKFWWHWSFLVGWHWALCSPHCGTIAALPRPRQARQKPRTILLLIFVFASGPFLWLEPEKVSICRRIAGTLLAKK